MFKIKASMQIPVDSKVITKDEGYDGYVYDIEAADGDIEIVVIGAIPSSESTKEIIAEVKEVAIEEGLSGNFKTITSNDTKIYYNSGLVYDEVYEGDMLKMFMFFQSINNPKHRVFLTINTYEVDKPIADAIKKIADSFVLTDNTPAFDYNVTPSQAKSVVNNNVAPQATKATESTVKTILSSELFNSAVSVAKSHLTKGEDKSTKTENLVNNILKFF